MCGIAGFTIHAVPPAERRARYAPRLRAMTASLRHRGPDAQSALLRDGIALGHTRLAIVDPEGGAQPMTDLSGRVTLVFNGEIFNYVELRERLASGYTFTTTSDTEVVLASYLAKGIACVDDFNGQFAFAIHDARTETLWLVRDRVGIVPLHFALTADGIAFASEAKALFAGGWVRPALDPIALKQTLQLWSPVEPRTMFEGVSQLGPGCVARWRAGALTVSRYWDLDLDVAPLDLRDGDAACDLGDLLGSAVRMRLRADVPVASYLSGGIDSSLLAAIAQEHLGGSLATFSVAFADPRYDERPYQAEVAGALATDHRCVTVTDERIAALLPDVVAHAEQVLLRAAPAPLFLLSELVHERDTKVVLTGEGADEIFLGYDLYRETKVREFWSRRPDSAMRRSLVRGLYPYLELSEARAAMLAEFFAIGLERPGDAAFTHLPRWSASGRTQRFLSRDMADRSADEDPVASVIASLPARVHAWRPLARAQYLEMRTLLAGYLLSAQGDRMLMAHSVEGRFPFLDHRLIEFAAALPERMKLRGLAEKWILKRYAAGRVPERVLRRRKFPYRAPVTRVLTGPNAPDWARALLSRDAIAARGIFDEARVAALLEKVARPGAVTSEADGQAVTAIATTQLLADRFLASVTVPETDLDAVRLVAA